MPFLSRIVRKGKGNNDKSHKDTRTNKASKEDKRTSKESRSKRTRKRTKERTKEGQTRKRSFIRLTTHAHKSPTSHAKHASNTNPHKRPKPR